MSVKIYSLYAVSTINAESITANNRTTLTSGGLYDNATNGNNIGFGFGAGVIISTDGSGTYSAQNLGNSTYPWYSGTFAGKLTIGNSAEWSLSKLLVEGTIATKPAGVNAYYSYLKSNWSADNAFEMGISDGTNLYKLITSSDYYWGSTLQFWTNNVEKGRFTSGGSLLVGDTVVPGETAWFGTAVFGKNGTDKIITGYLTSSTNGATIGAHNSALDAWANLNITGTNLIFRINQVENMRLNSSGDLLVGTTSSIWGTSGRGIIQLNGATQALIGLSIGGASKAYLFHQGTNLSVWNEANGKIEFGTNNTLRLTIEAGGDATFTSALSTGGNATFGLGANRPVTYDTNGGNFRINGSVGGWATGYFFNGSSGTFRGGFGGYGGADALTYYWIGNDYNAASLYINPNTNTVTASGLLKVDTGGASYAEINSTANWAYLRLSNNTTAIWDIASYNGGSLEFRPGGGASNATIISSAGRVSSVAWTTTGRNYSYEWLEFPNYSGLYSSNNGAHFYPNNGSYGAWMIGGGRNGWGGLEFDYGSNGNITLMISGDSNTVGFHNNSYGWQFLWQNGTLYVYKDSYGAGTQAAVLDSVNYGDYALPLAGGILTGIVQSYEAIESDIAFRTAGKFELTSSLMGLKSNYYDTEFYPSNGSYWNITTTSTATGGALLFRQGYEGTTKGYVYWDSSGFGLLNNIGGWSVRANYGGSYGGYLNGSWGVGVVSPVTALDVEGGAYSNTTAKFGASKPIYLVNNDPNIGFNLYYNSGWKYGAGSSSSFGGDLEFTSATGDFSLKTSAAAGNANNTATLTPLMTWKQNGNVGINTTAPTNYSGYTTLHINGKSTGGGGLLRLTTSDSSVAVNIYTNTNGAIYDTTTAHPHIFNINGNTNLIVSGDGISTADPGNGAVPWKLGDVRNEPVALVTNQYIEVEINGSYYRLALVEPA